VLAGIGDAVAAAKIIDGEHIGTLGTLVEGYTISTNRCEAAHRQCEGRALIRAGPVSTQHYAP
jgi:hypothetical protein